MTAPKAIRPFNFHGCDLETPPDGDGDWIGDCPFCAKESHFYVNAGTGQWDCKTCGEQGNIPGFLTKYAFQCFSDTPRSMWKKLAKNRGIPSGVLKARGVGWDPQQNRWLIPCFSATGLAHDVRVWSKKKGMMCTKSCKSQLYGVDQLAKEKSRTVYLCEGEWDAIAMDYLLRETGEVGVAVAVPGANTLKREWGDAFAGRDIVAIYDADDAGDKGALKAERMLKPAAKSMKFVCWPDSVTKGWDLRDHIKATRGEDPDDSEWAVEAFAELKELCRSHPRRGHDVKVTEVSPSATGAARELPKLRDMDFQELASEFSKRILMTPDTACALKVMMAISLSTDIHSDPLWLYVVGAPGAGKTLMLQALQGSERNTFRSTITPHGLVSGWSQGDPSLIPRLSGKCLVVKDFTEILSMLPAARDEIYSTLRGAFDGSVDKSFGNGVHRVYNRHTDPPFLGFSMLAGVTHAIHGHKEASLGERFLKFQLKPPRKEIAKEINRAALNSIGQEREREDALQWATACFLNRKVDLVTLPRFPEKLIDRLDALVTLIAYMRTQVAKDRYTSEILYRPVQEAGTRLMKQLGQLGRLLAMIDGEFEVTERQFDIVERVAFDTASGFHLEIVDKIMATGGKCTRKYIADQMCLSDATIHRRFDDLQVLQAIVKTEELVASGKGRPARLWEVTKTVARIWRDAKGIKCPPPKKSSAIRKKRKRRNKSGSSTRGSAEPSLKIFQGRKTGKTARKRK